MKNIEQLMYDTFNKKIRVTCKDGQVLEGVNRNFTQSLDNEPEVAAMCIQEERYTHLTEITEPEIEKIEIIK